MRWRAAGGIACRAGARSCPATSQALAWDAAEGTCTAGGPSWVTRFGSQSGGLGLVGRGGRWIPGSCRGFAASAAAVASASLCAVVASCEEDRASDGRPSAVRLLADAKEKLLPRWRAIERRVDQDLSSLSGELTHKQATYARRKGPSFSVRGQDKISVRFPLRPGCDASSLLAQVLPTDCAFTARAWDSAVARQLSFVPESDPPGLTVLLFTPLVGSDLQEVEFIKGDGGSLSKEDVRCIERAMELATEVSTAAGVPMRAKVALEAPREHFAGPRGQGEGAQEVKGKLEALGCVVTMPGPEKVRVKEGVLKSKASSSEAVGHWGDLIGYEDQKREIEDSLLLALVGSETYARISHGARTGALPPKPESHASTGQAEAGEAEQPCAVPPASQCLPRAFLFEGPPGTGKTSCARQLASMALAPLVYVPTEAVASKYYGESEKTLAEVFRLAERLGEEAAAGEGAGGCVVFLDEIDALATSRGGDMHEATRRTLGVLLRQLDGFRAPSPAVAGELGAARGRVVVVAATNRKGDLDAALMSRFDSAVRFGLPDGACRAKQIAHRARHLGDRAVEGLARASEGFSGRDLADLCAKAERAWAAKVLRGEESEGLPPVGEYERACEDRTRAKEKWKEDA